MRVIKKPYKVLIVDDEEMYVDLLKSYLNDIEAGAFNITTSIKPDDALSLLKNGSYDILITDLLMPRVSGEDLVREARENSKGTQVIVVSGSDTLQRAVDSYSLGASSFIRKPFNRNDIDVALKIVLKQISHWEALFEHIMVRKSAKKNS